MASEDRSYDGAQDRPQPIPQDWTPDEFPHWPRSYEASRTGYASPFQRRSYDTPGYRLENNASVRYQRLQAELAFHSMGERSIFHRSQDTIEDNVRSQTPVCPPGHWSDDRLQGRLFPGPDPLVWPGSQDEAMAKSMLLDRTTNGQDSPEDIRPARALDQTSDRSRDQHHGKEPILSISQLCHLSHPNRGPRSRPEEPPRELASAQETSPYAMVIDIDGNAETESSTTSLCSSNNDPDDTPDVSEFTYYNYAHNGPEYNWVNWLEKDEEEPRFPSGSDNPSDEEGHHDSNDYMDVCEGVSDEYKEWEESAQSLPPGDGLYIYSASEPIREPREEFISDSESSPSPSSSSELDDTSHTKTLTQSDLIALKSATLSLYSPSSFVSLPQVSEYLAMVPKNEIISLLDSHLRLYKATATTKITTTTELKLDHPDSTIRHILHQAFEKDTQDTEVQEPDFLASLRDTQISVLREALRKALARLDVPEIYQILIAPRVRDEGAAFMELYGSAAAREGDGEAWGKEGGFGLHSSRWWESMYKGLEEFDEDF
ncbi:hypothetical protein BDW59DRAFT_160837 [Aspergillus cavernicola]|uniref:Uncharacterized protein n=1 Tax=Aspergillus cavernicola TaxID=176166 RepID=A0ABR4IHE5_9EURO